MDAWVVDCSAFMPLVFSDENASGVESLLIKAARHETRIVVPALFWYEVSNVLRMAVVRGRLNEELAEGALYRFTGLPIETDSETSPVIVMRISSFAFKHDLTAYDAAYFELAERYSAGLLTADKGLLKLMTDYDWVTSSPGGAT